MDEAPTTRPVAGPLPPGLHPYLVLQTEPDTAAPGARFAGYGALVRQSRLPCVQFDRTRCRAVERTIALARDGDPEVTATVLRDAAGFVAADPTWLGIAAEIGTRTVWLAHGDPAAPPRELGAFAPGQLEVVAAGTGFRRDVPLGALWAAVGRCAPAALADDPGDTAARRARLLPWLQGRVAELGHGGGKVHPAAVGVDAWKCDPWDWIADVRDLWFAADGCFDTVLGAPGLADLWHPHQALDEWLRVLRPGGHLVLSLPRPERGGPAALAALLREVGGAEVVRGGEAKERGGELVARRRPRRTFVARRGERPQPVVSVLVVGEVFDGGDGAALRSTIASAQAALAGTPHEILVLERDAPAADDRAALRDVAARDGAVWVQRDRRPLPYARLVELLREAAAGAELLVLGPGSSLDRDGLARMRAALAGSARAALARPVDPAGRALPADDAPGAALLVTAAAWPAGSTAEAPYATSRLWTALARRLGAVTVDATVLTGGMSDRALRGHGLSALAFDDALLSRGVDPMRPPAPSRILFAAPRTPGDCVLATPALRALAARHPGARIDVLTRPDCAFVFRRQPGVARVVVSPPAGDGDAFLAEDRIVAAALAEAAYDRLVVLSELRDQVPALRSGLSLAAFYACQAGVPAAGDDAPHVPLSATAHADWQARSRAMGLPPRYAVLHAQGSADETAAAAALWRAIASELDRRQLRAVVVGAAGERVDHPAALQLAGQLDLEQTAAAIAGAAVFVGPDAFPLHVASAAGVPSLALYGGGRSHLRAAPPAAPRACAVQTGRGCSRPCGAAACREPACSFDRLTAAEVLPRLRELLDGAPPAREWRGAAPARCIDHPDGAFLLDADASLCRPLLPPPRPTAQAAAQPAPAMAQDPAEVVPLAVDLDAQALAAHAASLRDRLVRPAGGADGALLARRLVDLRSLPPLLAADQLQTAARQCVRLGDQEGALLFWTAALDLAADAVAGRAGPARTAFVALADLVLREAIATSSRGAHRWQIRAELLARHRAAAGRAAAPADLALALPSDDGEPPLAAGGAAAGRRVLSALIGRSDLQPLLALAPRLAELGDVAAALRHLLRLADRLPPAARAERAQVACLRGVLLMRDPRRHRAARAELEFAAEHLPDAAGRARARRIAVSLATHGDGAAV